MKESAVRRKKFILGVTGGFGTGKSTVAKYFKRFGAKVIDADKIAQSLLNPGTEVYRKAVDIFGESILKNNKDIDRIKLAGIVFNDNNLLERLNKLIHPEVKKIIKQEILRASEKIIILDVPLLFEAKLENIVDKIIVVKAGRAEQIQRLCNRSLFTKEDIVKRINAQMSLSDKVRLADFVIDNSGTFDNTNKQVEKLRRVLWKNLI